MIKRLCIALVALVALHAASATAVPRTLVGTRCDNFFGQHCLISLSTGVRMSYFELGSAAGEPLILLHTDTTSAIEWAWTVDALLAINPSLHIYALDQRGAGATGLPATRACWSKPNICITQQDLARDVLAFMDAKHVRKATLVGHAMGAGAARAVALLYPTRVTRLILSGTGLPPVVVAPQTSAPLGASLASLGWQKMLEAKGVAWPAGALHLRPIDIDPDAVYHITQYWDISAIAPPEMVALIAAQTATQSLATWGVIDPTPMPPTQSEKLETLSVPTLVLWGSEDAGLDQASQQRLIAVLQQAAKANPHMYFYWKQYGVRPPPASHNKHDADDIGHNLSWDAPRQLAADIDSFVRTGAPTPDRYRTDAPGDIHQIVVEPGLAVIVSSRP